MNYKIQIIVDDKLNRYIRLNAKKVGLSVSSFARYALLKGLSNNKEKMLDAAIKDLENGNVESISYEDFVKMLDEL